MATSGLIAANKDNNLDIAGVAWGSKIIPYLLPSPLTNSCPVIRALQKAILDGADVINMSFSSTTNDASLHNQIILATQTGRTNQWDNTIHYGCVVVGSAGNMNDGTTKYYPAAWDEVIGVIASNPDDKRGKSSDGWGNWSNGGSNFGKHYTVSAPGSVISVLDFMGANGLKPENYYNANGTSWSAPIVSGIAAIMLDKNKGLYYNEVKDLVKNNAEKVGGYTYDSNGQSDDFSYGRVSCIKSLDQTTVGISPKTIPQNEFFKVYRSGSKELTVFYKLNEND
jgi:hypothetical protein